QEAPLEGWMEQGWVIRTLLEHRAMHAETLSYLIHRLPSSLKRPGPTPLIGNPARPNAWVPVPAGEVTLGLDRERAPFAGWDNEYPEHARHVDAFELQRDPVSNLAFLEFVETGGYQDRRLWADADWAWL